MANKKLAALLLTAAILAGISLEANASDMGTPVRLSVQNSIPQAQQAVKTAPRSLAENKTNIELYQTVTRIGNKILAANDIKTAVKFQLVDKNVVNATTDIENTVDIYTGLLAYCHNEDELAFVIGHEIGHAVKSHVIKGAVINTTVATGANVGNKIIATKIASSSFGGKMNSLGLGTMVTNTATTAVNVTGTAAVAKINRGQEVDADLLGIDFIVKAGYSPMAGIAIMEKIGDNYNDFFADHPSTEKRLATMNKHIQENYPQFIKGTNSYKK